MAEIEQRLAKKLEAESAVWGEYTQARINCLVATFQIIESEGVGAKVGAAVEDAGIFLEMARRLQALGLVVFIYVKDGHRNGYAVTEPTTMLTLEQVRELIERNETGD